MLENEICSLLHYLPLQLSMCYCCFDSCTGCGSWFVPESSRCSGPVCAVYCGMSLAPGALKDILEHKNTWTTRWKQYNQTYRSRNKIGKSYSKQICLSLSFKLGNTASYCYCKSMLMYCVVIAHIVTMGTVRQCSFVFVRHFLSYCPAWIQMHRRESVL